MGSGSWSKDAYTHISSSYSTKTVDQIFTAKSTTKDMKPVGVDFRESRDSDEHPDTLAIIVYVDVTGSMGRIPEDLIRHKLGAFMETLLSNGVEHPQILFGAIGDQYSDTAPLQVGQFESETTLLNKWLSDIYLEGWGGGQAKESYLLGWLFAARHTSIDCFEKRGIKGFLFTIGDEFTWDRVDVAELKKIMGYEQTEGVSAEQLLEEAKRMYHVFHLHVQEGAYRDSTKIIDGWKDLLNERLIMIEDYTKIAEIMATTVAVINGADIADVVADFDHNTAGMVTSALAKVSSTVSKVESGVIKL